MHVWYFFLQFWYHAFKAWVYMLHTPTTILTTPWPLIGVDLEELYWFISMYLEWAYIIDEATFTLFWEYDNLTLRFIESTNSMDFPSFSQFAYFHRFPDNKFPYNYAKIHMHHRTWLAWTWSTSSQTDNAKVSPDTL